MKKFSKKAFSAFSLSALFFFTACNDVIFDTIREEVELADAQIQGSIHSLVRVKDASDSKEYLFLTSNPVVWRKDVNEATTKGGTDSAEDGTTTSENGHWYKFSRPGDNFVWLVSNHNGEIYSLSTILEEVTDEGEVVPTGRKLKYYDTSAPEKEWQTVTIESGEETSSDSNLNMNNYIFCTNTPKNENRYAFARLDGKIYKLEGGKATFIEESSSYRFPLDGSSEPVYSEIRGVATFDGSVFYFTNSPATTSNETYETSATMLYYASGTTIYYRTKTDTDWASKSTGSDAVYSIAVTADKILLGTTDGLDNVTLDEDKIPTGNSVSPSANASSTLTSSYEITKLLVIDPSKTDTETDIYAASNFTGSPSSTTATRKNSSLWSYYPEPGRGKWNRE
ncbi:hypothetical protein [uncultured Treponema sp.]|uniref:hypothetical protein n=1 Tax=uncultured Treponema sp. TaxID=162155 RepID=UPI0015C1B44D|nr:hypothetical protein [uncultured Treponema sp.]